MASQVLSGTSNVSYTNTTGQNVRIVINYMASANVDTGGTTIKRINLSWAGVTVTANYLIAIGRNLAFNVGSNVSGGVSIVANNMANDEVIPATFGSLAEVYNNALPTEIMLAAGQSFSATCGAYNIVVIPEAG